ncbi:MAG: hypothetical protein M3550_02155 [Actinomycetota bacterium]|nr:hypothetical protein [Actinomycetota bacterium]
MALRFAFVVFALSAGFLPAPQAWAQPPGDASPGVELVASIPDRGIISARARGNYLFASTVSGLSVYDISVAAKPVRVGRLELPNSQNEDVELGGKVLLITDEPLVGKAQLHLVDISDPVNPRLLSSYDTYPRSGGRKGGIGHTASCIQECRYAYLAGGPGIEIIDLRDPARPRFAARFGAREATGGRMGTTHDVQLDAGGLAWVAGTGGTAAYDVSDPVHPRLALRTDRSANALGRRSPRRDGLNDFIHHNSLRLGADAPDIVTITEEDITNGCRRAGSFQTWRIGSGGTLRNLDSWTAERDRGAGTCSAHYHDARDGLVAQGWYDQGVRLLSVRRPERIRQVGWWVPRKGAVWGALFAPTDPSGSTVYALNHGRGIDVLQLDRGRLRPAVRRPARRGTRHSQSNTSSLLIVPGKGREQIGAANTVKPGQTFGVKLIVFAVSDLLRGGTAELAVPPELGRPRGRGVRWDPVTRTARVRISSMGRGMIVRLRFKVRRRIRPGRFFLEATVRSRTDVFALDDRALVTFQVRAGKGLTSAALRQPLYCRLAG